MATVLKAVIFDYSTILLSDVAVVREIRQLWADLRSRGLKIIAVSTHARNLSTQLCQQMLSTQPDHCFIADELGVKKGSYEFVNSICQATNLTPNELLYVGDDKQDWTTAINSRIFFLLAAWSPKLNQAGITALRAASPADVYRFATHFLLSPPRWQFSLDVPGSPVHVRSLLAQDTTFQDDDGRTFKLHGILQNGDQRKVGGMDAVDLLILHALTSLSLEGLVGANPYLAIYPSSTPGKRNPVIERVLSTDAKFFHGWGKDVLLRHTQAPDTSLLKFKKLHDQVTYLTQANTVCLHPKVDVEGRSVIVFDDFSTSGKSLDWARNLLVSAGAEQVVLISIGKYGLTNLNQEIYTSSASGIVQPFNPKTYKSEDFTRAVHRLRQDVAAPKLIQRSLDYWRQGLPLP